MPAVRIPSSNIKKHSHSATPPSSASGDDMDNMNHPPRSKQKLDNGSSRSAAEDKLKRKRQSQSAFAAMPVAPAKFDVHDQTLQTVDDSNGLIPMTTGPDGSKQVAQCKHCIALGIKCTYDYQPKKRGPPNLYLRRLQEAAAAAAMAASGGVPDSLISPMATTPTHIVPSQARSNSNGGGYFSSSTNINGNGQMVVPSQSHNSLSSPNHNNSSNNTFSTHSFMDTNTISQPHHTSLPSLDTQLGSTHHQHHPFSAHPHQQQHQQTQLPSLPSLTSISPWGNIASPTSSVNNQLGGAEWIQPQHVPMHLQPSPARLSPILGHATNVGLPPTNGVMNGSAAGLSSGSNGAGQSSSSSTAGTSNNPNNLSVIPPSRYPIAADLSGLADAVRPSRKDHTGATGNGSTPPPSTGNSIASSSGITAVESVTSNHSGNNTRSYENAAAKANIGAHVHGHYSQMATGFLPSYVHSRASSPVPGEQGNGTTQHATNTMNSMNGGGVGSSVPLTLSSAAEIFPQHPLYNWRMPYKEIDDLTSSPSSTAMDSRVQQTQQQQQQQQEMQCNAVVHPPLASFHRSHPLTTLAPLPLIMHILTLFFDYVYPLTPCVHKPSFYEGLREKREEKDPLFFALVCSTVASTLVQVPRSYLPLERDEVRKLAKKFSEASRLVTIASYDPPSSILVVIRYFDNVYHFCEGHDATSHAAFGEAAHIAVTLHMHEEASYEGLDFIESEVRRRAFWLLFGADKSMSILLGRPICLRDEDCTLHFPREVDDEYITAHAIHPQPPNKTAVVSGLNYISRIFALLGEILVRIRVDKRSPPQGPFAIARLEEVRALHQRICSALAHAPPELRLKSGGRRDGLKQELTGTGGSTTSAVNGADFGGVAFTENAFQEIKEFFDSPNAHRDDASNPYLVMQANLYVTQQLVRFVIEQYRHELITLMRENMSDPSQCGSLAAAAELQKGGWTSEEREAVASDLLNVLHSIPIPAIATNGPSLVHKVRFVASTLLDSVRKAETAPASAARAHAYLWDFLSILSEIERNYLLADDREVDFNS
ncbi:hypothetical protein FRB98_005598 [Tulasnella sp. 332]|nr:hypothetical protein FRB98_005598 [Tulasnella sp. 332]